MNLLRKFFSLFLAGLAFCTILMVSQQSLTSQTVVTHDQPALVAQISTVRLNQLPPEAKTTLKLIDQGGPFPYQKDGTIFNNREGILPSKPKGYYREYTVPTPGEHSRGPRRFVVGQNGEIYYTSDHYRSFSKVIR